MTGALKEEIEWSGKSFPYLYWLKELPKDLHRSGEVSGLLLASCFLVNG